MRWSSGTMCKETVVARAAMILVFMLWGTEVQAQKQAPPPPSPLVEQAAGAARTAAQQQGAIRAGFSGGQLLPNDDGSSGAVEIGFPVNFFGVVQNYLYINNNGNVTFDQPLAEYQPFDLSVTSRVIIAPFFADVDTRNEASGVVTAGYGTVDGRTAFGVNWIDVGYYEARADKRNSFQLVLIDRSDTGDGNFDFEFNYAAIEWETGDASGGENGLGGGSARVGYSNGSDVSFELEGSGVPGSFLDTNDDTGLIYNALNSTTPGRYVFQVREGTVSCALVIRSLLPGTAVTARPGEQVTYQVVVGEANGSTVTGASVVVNDGLLQRVAIVGPTPADGLVSYVTSVPADKAAGIYDLTFQAVREGCVESAFVTRSVSVQRDQLLTVTQPNGGEQWMAGSPYEIRWTSQNVAGDVRIDLYQDANYITTIAPGTENDGAYLWTIAADRTPGDGYRVRVSSIDAPNVWDESDAGFEIVHPVNPQITVAAPNGGEIWLFGETYEINWESQDVAGPIRIDLLLNGNPLPSPVVASTEDDGSFMWTVPGTLDESEGYRVFVSSVPSPTITDQSDEDFAIRRASDPQIAVEAPNGGEAWRQGHTYEIRWTSQDLPEAVGIELWRNGAFLLTLIGSTANDGSFSWKVPTVLGTGGGYTIRVVSTTRPGLADESDAPFSITPPPELTVAAPNGGEAWLQGETYEILWTSANLAGDVRIELWRGASLVATIAQNTAGDGSYLWAVPTTQAVGDDYRVRIVSAEEAAVWDESNAAFSIVAPVVSSITVEAPNGGEAWQQGQIHEIRWMSQYVEGNVAVELWRNGSFVLTIAANTPNDGVYGWPVPSTLAAGDGYRMRVESVADASVYDEGDADFTILEASTPTIMVEAPNGGEAWQQRQINEIRWTSQNVEGNVAVELWRNGSFVSTIASSTPNDGVYGWPVPSTLAAGDGYRVRVESVANASVYDESDAPFTIEEEGNPLLTVRAPNGGEVWRHGERQAIRWLSQDVAGNIRVELWKGGSFVSAIVEGTPNDGSHAWTVPSTLAEGDDYLIRIESAEDGSVWDESDAPFTIEEERNPLLTVRAPNGGEVWRHGETYAIRWLSQDIQGDLRVELWRDGSLASTIAAATANDGVFDWQVPDAQAPGGGYRIRISSLDEPSVYDESDAGFTIEARPEVDLTVDVPNGGEALRHGETYEVRWTSINVAGDVRIELWQGGAFSRTIASRPASDVVHFWQVPADLSPADDYRVRIISAADAGVWDESDADFAILPALDPALTVVAPNGGEAWRLGETHEIRWTKQDIGGDVRLELWRDGGLVLTIATRPAGDESYAWQVSSALERGDGYRVRIVSLQDGTVVDESDTPFALVSPELGPVESRHDFGDVAVGASAAWRFEIENVGNAPLAGTLSIPPGPFSASPASFVVPAGGRQSVDVTFAPPQAGDAAATLALTSDGGAASIELSGRGTFVDVRVSPPSLTFASTFVGATSEQTVTIENAGNVAVPVEGIDVEPASSAFAAVDGAAGMLPAGGTRAVSVAFTPAAPGPASATLRVRYEGGEATVALQGEGAMPSIQVDAPARIEAPGQPVTVTVTTPPGFEPTRRLLHYRPGGAAAYQQATLVQTASGARSADAVYTGTMDPAFVTERGVEFYVELAEGSLEIFFPAENPATQPAYVPVSVTSFVPDVVLQPARYSMVSFPVQFADASLQAVLVDDYDAYEPTAWRVLRWNAAREAYDEFDEIAAPPGPGIGFWLITADGASFDVDGATSVGAEGVREVPLAADGWTQVGNPFAYRVAWSTVERPDGVSQPIAHFWSEADGQYVAQAVSVLEPWAGYWVRNTNATGQVLRFHPEESVGVPSKQGALAVDGAYGLGLTAEYRSRGMRDPHNWIGFAPGAREGLDEADVPEVPALGDRVALAVVAADGRLATDVRPPSAEGGYWDLEVGTVLPMRPERGARTVHVRVDEQGDLPEGFRYFVLDLDAGAALPVEDGVFRVTVTDDRPVGRLRVILGTASYAESVSEDMPLVPVEDALEPNYPNPFNPETVIPYQLSRRGQVVLEVFDVLGRRVATLVAGEQGAGRHEVRWDGRDAAGRTVASGLYVYRLRTEHYRAVRSMLLLR